MPTAAAPIKKARLSLANKAPTQPTTAAGPPMTSMPPTQPSAPRAPLSEVNGTDMRPGYDASMVIGRDGGVLSFEEVRAMNPRYAYKKSAPREAPPAAPVVPPSSKSFTPESSPIHHQHHNNGISPRHPSPTICTRAAMQDIESMFKDSPMTAPFSSRSLTSDIPSMDGVVIDLNTRGRPSPVAFTVFTDEELLTRNVAQSAAQAEREAASASFAQKAYPPLTPILEMSHESDMSHVSNTSMGAPTPASRSQPPAQSPQQIQVYDENAAPSATATAADPAAIGDNVVDPFDSAQREQWIGELSVLTTDGVTDLSNETCPFDLEALASGDETSIELGDKLFQVTSVLSSFGTGVNRSVTLLVENLLDGGELVLRLAPRTTVLEQVFAQAGVARIIATGGGTNEIEAQVRSFFLATQESVVYADACCSISATSGRGTMRQLLKAYERDGKKMDERLVAFYSYELLKLVHLLHTNGLLHNSLTPDSVWLRFDDTAAWSDNWSPIGEGGWNSKGLSLSEFSSSIDRSLFPTDAAFRCENSAATAMSSNPLLPFTQDALGLTSWAEQLDLLSIAAVIYAMLFGGVGDMDCVLDESGSIQLVQPLSSEFAQTTFAPVFETILNFRPSQATTASQESQDLINLLMQHFEMAIGMEVNGQTVSSQIKNLLCRQQMMQLQK